MKGLDGEEPRLTQEITPGRTPKRLLSIEETAR
jgi:hypothetical protein